MSARLTMAGLLALEGALTPRCEVCAVKLVPEVRATTVLADGVFRHFCDEHLPPVWHDLPALSPDSLRVGP